MAARLNSVGVAMTATGRLVALFTLVVGLVVPIVASPSAADAYGVCPVGMVQWTGPAGGLWSAGANWSGGAVPAGSDDVCIAAGATVTIDTPAATRQLISEGSLIVTSTGTLTVNSVPGTTPWIQNSWIQQVDNYGTISLTSGALNARIAALGDGAVLNADAGAEFSAVGRDVAAPWYGTMNGAVAITGAGTVDLGGRYEATSVTTVTSAGGAIQLTGTLDGGTAGMTLYGDLVWNEYSGFIGLVTNEGTITSTVGRGGDIWRHIIGDFTNNGTIIWNPGGGRIGATNYNSTTTIVNNGLIRTLAYMTFVDFGRGGTIINRGTIDATGGLNPTGLTVINEGTWSVSTDPVSVSKPLATSVRTPTGGLVSIVEESPVPVSPPAGYAVVGTEFSSITAPDGSVADPLLITFTVDASVWDTFPLSTLSVLRNGVAVPDCTTPGVTGPASPDPCIGSRSGTVGSPAQIVVRTSVASEWVVVRSLNTAPTVAVDAVAPTAVGESIAIDASISDPDVGDTHVCVVDWGDGSTTSGVVSGLSCTASSVYSLAGVFDVSVTVTDAAGASATAGTVVVVFDPDATVEGEGEFDSPAGAYPENPSLAGEAEFEFEAEYGDEDGVWVVEGDVEFEFDDLEFESDAVSWLVVTDGEARATGTGTLNDVDGYGFEVWATDGSSDTFRIRIWTTDPSGTVIYDNDPGQELTEGKITTNTKEHEDDDRDDD